MDDLLEKAGATHVTHVHGEINKLRCTSCDYSWASSIDDYSVDVECPRCDNCYNVKPAVVFFNEPAPEYDKLLALRYNIRPQDIFIVVGTALHVVGLNVCVPNNRINNNYRFNWQVNPEPVNISSFGVIEAVNSGVGLKNLERLLFNLM